MLRRQLTTTTTIALAAAALAGLPAASAGAAAQSAVRAASAKLTTGVVLKAFRAAGITLQDTTYGSQQPVTALAPIRFNGRYNIAVYIYSSPALATSSFTTNARAWQASGFAVTHVKNVVVTVVPKGRILGVKAPPAALPAPVDAAVKQLSRS